jgi:hypothetical protein
MGSARGPRTAPRFKHPTLLLLGTFAREGGSDSVQFTVQVRALCEKAKEILMEESNVQVLCFTSLYAKMIVLAKRSLIPC